MDILRQCELWHEQDEFQRIIDALEAIPEGERSPEMDLELARAYNNRGVFEDGRPSLLQARDLLLKHEGRFDDDHIWNFRLAYALFHLGDAAAALPLFEKALEALPGDEDTLYFIDVCTRHLSVPVFLESFAERVEAFWEAFGEEEAELRELIRADADHGPQVEAVRRMEGLLYRVFDEVSFELGFNGERPELILSPDGDQARLFELVRLRADAPEDLLGRWSILIGRQPVGAVDLRFEDGWELSPSEVQVRYERGDGAVSVTLFCERLLPLLHSDAARAEWMLAVLLDQVLGELCCMQLIEGLEVSAEPLGDGAIALAELREALDREGLGFEGDPASALDRHAAYGAEPSHDPEGGLRSDVIAGYTGCVPLLAEYLEGECATLDALHRDGATAGYLAFPLDGLVEWEDDTRLFAFREALEEALLCEGGAQSVAIIGTATGLECGYLDLIAWDLPAVLERATSFFAQSEVAWAAYRSFRPEAVGVTLHDRESEEGEAEEAGEAGGDDSSVGGFVGFVLMSDPSWDPDRLKADLSRSWGIDASEDDDLEGDDPEDGDGLEGDPEAGDEVETLVFRVGDSVVALSLFPVPVPDGEAERAAQSNYAWPEAVDVARTHRAQIMVAVFGGKEEAPALGDLRERGSLFAKVVASCCEQEGALGVYASGTVFEPSKYAFFAREMIGEGALPLINLVWIGLYGHEGRVCGYTFGLESFGKRELEVIDADASPGEVHAFLLRMASYVLESDATLRDGETIGLSAEERHPIEESEGVAHPGQPTLKVGWESL